jgi:hypothetical protein
MNRQGGYIGINRTTASGIGGSGVFTMDAFYRAILSETWSTEFSVFNYNYMGSSKWDLQGTWGTNSSTVLAQDGASYPTFVRAISNTSQKGLNASSWTLDFQFNKTGLNSNPYPGQHLAITKSDTSSGIGTDLSLVAGDKLIDCEASNNYSMQFTVYDFTGTSMYSASFNDSAFSVGGHPSRVTFDFPTATFTWYVANGTSTDDLVQKGQYTLSTSQQTAMLGATGRARDLHIGVSGRGGTDGVRNVVWATT